MQIIRPTTDNGRQSTDTRLRHLWERACGAFNSALRNSGFSPLAKMNAPQARSYEYNDRIIKESSAVDGRSQKK